MSAGSALPALGVVAFVALEVHRSRLASHRTVVLNRALHELRRPLQALVLLAERPLPERAALRGCLEQARGALGELDATINGGAGAPVASPTPLSDLTSGLGRRWRPFGVAVHAVPDEGAVIADPVRLGAALDNLVANAFDHGSGRVDVRAFTEGDVARIEVRDEGPSSRQAPTGDPRRGHGLVLARAAASDSGGALIGPSASEDGGTFAALTLPLTGRG